MQTTPNKNLSNSGLRWIHLVLALCLGLRLAMFAQTGLWNQPVQTQILLNSDSPLYHLLACNLLDGKGFASDGTGGPPSLHPALNHGQPDDLRTPVYPLFIAVIYAVFGRLPWVVSLFQIALSTLTCYILYHAVRRVCAEGVAVAAAWFFAVEPILILYTPWLLTETLFLFLLVLGFYLYVVLVWSRPEPVSVWKYALFGAIAGVIALTRPVGQYLPVALAVPLVYSLRRRIVVATTGAALFLAAFLIVLSPWLIRNSHLFGAPKLTYIGSWDLLALDVGMMEASKSDADLETVSARLLAEADSIMVRDGYAPANLTFMQKSPYWERLALRYIVHDPVRFGIQHVKGAVFGFANLATSDYSRAVGAPVYSMSRFSVHPEGALNAFLTRKSSTELLFAVFAGLMMLITYAFSAIGLVYGWKTLDRRIFGLLLTIILYFMGVTGAIGLARLKMPMIPFYLIFAGLGFVRAKDWWKSRTGRSATE